MDLEQLQEAGEVCAVHGKLALLQTLFQVPDEEVHQESRNPGMAQEHQGPALIGRLDRAVEAKQARGPVQSLEGVLAAHPPRRGPGTPLGCLLSRKRCARGACTGCCGGKGGFLLLRRGDAPPAFQEGVGVLGQVRALPIELHTVRHHQLNVPRKILQGSVPAPCPVDLRTDGGQVHGPLDHIAVAGGDILGDRMGEHPPRVEANDLFQRPLEDSSIHRRGGRGSTTASRGAAWPRRGALRGARGRRRWQREGPGRRRMSLPSSAGVLEELRQRAPHRLHKPVPRLGPSFPAKGLSGRGKVE
mmetsp:Transcript_9844/g.27914  ORF Transcript_9844/g.27914 Transcript_9844/m.27914 type:complete len:302 (+) Transcript_9844:726-1631(+)